MNNASDTRCVDGVLEICDGEAWTFVADCVADRVD